MPRLIGVLSDGSELLTYMDGVVTQTAIPDVWTEDVLRKVGRTMRELHELCGEFRPAPGTIWYFSNQADDPAAIVCHRDVAPRNIVIQPGGDIAFIDWDFCSPAPPSWDLAHGCWQCIPLGPDESCRRQGWATARTASAGYPRCERVTVPYRVSISPRLSAVRWTSRWQGWKGVQEKGTAPSSGSSSPACPRR